MHDKTRQTYRSGIRRVQPQKLRNDEITAVVVDRASQTNDALLVAWCVPVMRIR